MKAKTHPIYIFVVAALACSLGCSNPLSIEPPFDTPTEIALDNASNLEAAVNGAYQALQSASFYGGTVFTYGDVFSDHFRSVPQAIERGNLSNYDLYRRFFFATAGGFWGSGYDAINRANNVLFAIQNENEIVTLRDENYENNKPRLLGESYFIRGVAFFELVRAYGRQYGFNSDATQSGVVLRLTPTRGRELKERATVRETYDQIINDLRLAIDLLPEDADFAIHPRSYGGKNGGRATKDAAKAMLAKVYWQMGTPATDDAALVLINDLLGGVGSTGQYPLTEIKRSPDERINNLFSRRGNSRDPEVIFQIVNTADVPSRSINSTAASLANTFTLRSDDQNLPPNIALSSLFLNSVGQGAVRNDPNVTASMFSSDDDDRSFTFVNSTSILGPSYSFVNKFFVAEDPVFGAVPIFNIPVARAADLLLMRAEINALKGQEELARQDINHLRSNRVRAGVTRNVTSAVTGNDLINFIRQERDREMFAEGNRVHSYRRYLALQESGYTVPVISPIMGRGNVPTNTNQGDGRDRILEEINLVSNQSLLFIPDAELFSNPVIANN